MEQLRDVARQYFHSRRTRLALRYTTMPADDEYESIIARGVGEPPLCTFHGQQQAGGDGGVGAPARTMSIAPLVMPGLPGRQFVVRLQLLSPARGEIWQPKYACGTLTEKQYDDLLLRYGLSACQ